MSTTTTPSVLEAQTDFGLNLLRDISSTSKTSIVLSPLSVAIALSMAYAGSRGDTEKELGELLAKGASSEKVHEYFGALINKIYEENKNYTLETANRIYVKEGLALLDSYKDLLNAHYKGQFESVDFTKNTETANQINQFVSEATHEKIKDLIQADSLNAMTRLLLVNAVYFKGSWLSKFESKHTATKTFYVTENKEKKVEMMHQTGKFFYRENENYQVLGMPYNGKDVLMYIILPRQRYGLDEVLKNLTGKELLDVFVKGYKPEVVVSIPKFKIESTHLLTENLRHSGLRNSLSSGADFSGISGSGGLQISEVIQKAFIETNEEGSEAAAATAIQVRLMSAGPSNDIFFNADHPFYYTIVTEQGETLFNGVFRE